MSQAQPFFMHLPDGAAHAAARTPAFTVFWSLAMAMLVLNLGQVLGLGNINALEKMLFLAAAVCYLHGKSRDPVAGAGLALMCLSTMITGLLTPFAAFSWVRLLFALIALIALAAFFLAPPTLAQRRLMLVSIACAPLILIAYSLLLAALLGRPLFMRDHTGASRLGGATIPAFLAAASYAATVAASFLYAENRKPRWMLVAGVALALCALSGTRMPSACAAASAALILMTALSSAGARLALAAGGGVLCTGFLLTAGDQILIRILSGSSSGRDKLWDSLAPWVDRYPLTGVGFGHHGLLIPEHVLRLTNTTAAHNEYLRLLVELGYAGEAAFLLGILLLFLGRRLYSRATWPLGVLLLAIFFLYASTDNVFYLSYALFVPLCIAVGAPLRAGRRPG